jgi:hypothetical protein
MELWIRSQDKEILTAVQHLDIYEASIEGEEECYVIEESGTDLGSYKSYQRALEVLDEIHNILKPKGILKFNVMLNNSDRMKIKEETNNEYLIVDRNVEVVQQPATYVYEMPEE